MTLLSPVHAMLLAAVFAWAAGSKLRRPAAFRSVLRKLLPTSVAVPVAVAVPIVEIALALVLLSGWHARMAALTAADVLILFTAALLRMRQLHVGGCGCFGERASGGSVAQGIVRNALLLGTAAWVAIAPPDTPPWGGGAALLLGRLTVVAGCVCAWGCAIGLIQSLRATRAMLAGRRAA